MATYNLIVLTAGSSVGVDMDGLFWASLTDMQVITRTSSQMILERAIPNGFPTPVLSAGTVFGIGLGYGALGQLFAGSVTGVSVTHYDPAQRTILDISGLTNVNPAALDAAFHAADNTTTLNLLLAGNDGGAGSPGGDVMRGYGGDDTLTGAGGADTIYGGTGNDLIYAGAAGGQDGSKTDSTYLRGEEGNDTIFGAAGFDDINGNQGDDVLHGGPGDDWVVGGKDNDNQSGDAGDDIVWGNLGNDTLDGGDGNDQIRGGQGDDIIFGGPGNDFVSGDRGNDTETGGAGADIFHSFSGAGIDRVLDFHVSEGDRVMLDPGTTFTVSQVGADTVIDMGGGDQVILVGVQMSSLPAGTIFLG